MWTGCVPYFECDSGSFNSVLIPFKIRNSKKTRNGRTTDRPTDGQTDGRISIPGYGEVSLYHLYSLFPVQHNLSRMVRALGYNKKFISLFPVQANLSKMVRALGYDKKFIDTLADECLKRRGLFPIRPRPPGFAPGGIVFEQSLPFTIERMSWILTTMLGEPPPLPGSSVTDSMVESVSGEATVKTNAPAQQAKSSKKQELYNTMGCVRLIIRSDRVEVVDVGTQTDFGGEPTASESRDSHVVLR